MASLGACIECRKDVSKRMNVLCCVECGGWQHLKCQGLHWPYIFGSQYKQMRQGKLRLTWTCDPCWGDICFKSSRPRVKISPIHSPPRERTETSPLRDLNTAFTARDDADSDSSDEDVVPIRKTSSRKLPELRWSDSSSDSSDSSDDEGEDNVQGRDPRPLTFEVMECGGPKGGTMLVDSWGHVYKRGQQNKSGQITWTCPFRNRIGFHSFCYSQVTQRGDVFTKSKDDHTHFPSGEDVAIVTRSKVKQLAETRRALPAADVVSTVLAALQTERRFPRFWRRSYTPSTASLNNVVVTHRQALRAKHKPDAIDDFLADLFGVHEEDFCTDDVIVHVTSKRAYAKRKREGVPTKSSKRTCTPRVDSEEPEQVVVKHRVATSRQPALPTLTDTTMLRAHLEDEPSTASSFKPAQSSSITDVTSLDSNPSSTVNLHRPSSEASNRPSVHPIVVEESPNPATLQPVHACDQPVTSFKCHGDVTYHVVDGGSRKGAQKLVSSECYTFTRKHGERGTVSGTINWRCSMRNKRLVCHGQVKQRGDKFDPRLDQHIHQPDPGAATKLRVFTKAKHLASHDVARSTRDIVQTVLAEVTSQEHRNLISETNLTRMITRHRHTLRKTQC